MPLFLRLPNEIWALILGFTDLQTLTAVSTTCSHLWAQSVHVLVRHLVWSSPRVAEQNLSCFWHQFPSKSRAVRSLTFLSTPPRIDESIVCEELRSTFDEMKIFSNGLRELVLCGLTLPSNFFELLEELGRLQQLVVRQCVVPEPPGRLSPPPRLQKLTVSFLSPIQNKAYSPYFPHLFPDVPFLAIDRDPTAHGPIPVVCAPQKMTMAADFHEISNPAEHYLSALAHFCLHKLERLEVFSPILYFQPFYVDPSFFAPWLAGSLPRLQTLLAPLSLVRALARVTKDLRCVAVTGTLCMDAHIFGLIDDLHQNGHPLRSLAIVLTSWDDRVLDSIADRFCELQALEILYLECEPELRRFHLPYHQPEPSERLLSTFKTAYLPRLPQLEVLHLHPFPDAIHTFTGTLRYPAPKKTVGEVATKTVASRLRLVQTIAGTSSLLTRLRLAHDHRASQTWVRHALDSPWTPIDEGYDEIQWSSARLVDMNLWATHPIDVYRGGIWSTVFID
ncbi:hypothetical protein HMN09_00457100 [Mycena chlorophos]|uniref:F-box domain-containing protein n=1 Tax=Mycena chlorophos TaxID=658473 RepID=A0A8H6TGQ9_MYCCL|nr:hypothetical protein HMN09_00457100 [Mycena chlorophos]